VLRDGKRVVATFTVGELKRHHAEVLRPKLEARARRREEEERARREERERARLAALPAVLDDLTDRLAALLHQTGKDLKKGLSNLLRTCIDLEVWQHRPDPAGQPHPDLLAWLHAEWPAGPALPSGPDGLSLTLDDLRRLCHSPRVLDHLGGRGDPGLDLPRDHLTALRWHWQGAGKRQRQQFLEELRADLERAE
jgi:hypothetical protein